jgi:gentisate 1,2-dioxygenase
VAISWASVDHEAFDRADLFAVSVRPVLQPFHLYREEELAIHQEITSTFVPLEAH